MQHDQIIALRQKVFSFSLVVCTLTAGVVAHAETPSKVTDPKTEVAKPSASGAEIKSGKMHAEGKAAAGSLIGKQGHNQYPGTSPKPLPKPKKEALEAIGAAKAKAAQ
jgi:hypothetical protein